MKTTITIVGAGIAGITLARRYAEEQNAEVLIVERRPYIGGYCYDYLDTNGIFIHKHGPHIFRTANKKVYSFLSRFTEWYDYQHKVLSYVGGHYYPMPINLDTVNLFSGGNYDSDTVMNYFEQVKTSPKVIDNVKDAVESQVGAQFYKAFFEQYTKKQWGMDPEKLPTSIISRIPIRTDRDNRYFTVPYQGIPVQGYTAMMQKMLEHPNIHILLNTDYNQIKDEILSEKVFYSGSIDEYFGYCYGKLPYRCVSFKLEEYDVEEYQPVAVVNYPNDYDYTRISEFKHFTNNKSKKTVIAKEFSSAEGDPSYPIPLQENQDLYEKYKKLAFEKKVSFIGRLGQYKYFSMDQIVENILDQKL
ncbi:MAG: UDP-galactopyranose mutase [Lachnospiraceae bacterium]|nr:UDP-galactopyranose mutase [Lachnospiraceae bacterium]